jgi:hypothetical protein
MVTSRKLNGKCPFMETCSEMRLQVVGDLLARVWRTFGKSPNSFGLETWWEMLTEYHCGGDIWGNAQIKVETHWTTFFAVSLDNLIC